jgi:hypothetical protein
MLKKDYPIYFDDTKLFWPSKWQESYSVVETTNQTEAGTDQVIVTRYDKLSVSCEFKCSDAWAATFTSFPRQGFHCRKALRSENPRLQDKDHAHPEL